MEDKIDLQEQALMVVQLQKDIEQNNERFKSFLEEQQNLANQLNQLKTLLKDEMSKHNIKELISPKGVEDWSIKVWETTKVSVENINEVDEEYIDFVEVNGISEKGGKYYQKTGNTKLVKNLVLNGVNPPKGFSIKKTPSIKITVNGKVV